AVRIALRTQQVIAHETGVVNTIDPLGGSYYDEHLTKELERQAYEYFDRIERLGGVVAAIKENFFQAEIADAAFRYQQEVETEQRVVVGVNRYQDVDEAAIRTLRIDEALERKQVGRLQSVRARRRGDEVEHALGQLKQAAGSGANLMEPILDCARVHASEGEIVEALQEVFGTYTETPVF
ncbi:MAG: methylmalonyl-CoA mutase, N-terminal domain, partial [Solirubrobacteraceae bacterium]|nr:methylmalonyl-CoA mutase, N-terminal domain [Solirubrobacteraceae bacterium]